MPIAPVYAGVVAVDWLVDRLRAPTNIRGNMFVATIFKKFTRIQEGDAADINGSGAKETAGGKKHDAGSGRLLHQWTTHG